MSCNAQLCTILKYCSIWQLSSGKPNLIRHAVIDFDAVRNDPKRQGLYFGLGFGLGGSISKYAGQALNLCNPAAIFLAVENDLEIHSKHLRG